jgi:HSP20 family molecular chaperone IbpA
MTMLAAAWRPAADVYVKPTTVDVTLEIPGVSLEDLRVDLLENALGIEGRRRLPDQVDVRGIYHVVEIRRGGFRAEIARPTRVETRPRELRCELGLLFVSFNKTESYHDDR